MNGVIVSLVIIVVLLVIIVVFICYLRDMFGDFLQKYFGTRDLKDAITRSEIEAENTPKSLSSMETLSLSSIKKDFPDLNINELKSMAENTITNYLDAIEKKSTKDLTKYNDTIKGLVSSKIQDIGDKNVSYDSIKIHKTVINRYEKNKSIATIYMASSVEYYYKEGNDSRKKIQDRFLVEIVYVIDANLVEDDKKLLGLNCPNCGAPISTLGEKHCKYCNTGIKDIVKRTWVINNIKEY